MQWWQNSQWPLSTSSACSWPNWLYFHPIVEVAPPWEVETAQEANFRTVMLHQTPTGTVTVLPTQQWPRSDPTMSAAGVTLVGAAVKRPRDPGSTQTSFSLGEYYKEGQRPVSLFLLSSFTHYYSATKEEGPGQVSSRFLEIQHNFQPLNKKILLQSWNYAPDKRT